MDFRFLKKCRIPSDSDSEFGWSGCQVVYDSEACVYTACVLRDANPPVCGV